MRRYGGLAQSRGTVIPALMRVRVLTRDQQTTGGCVGFGRLPGECEFAVELDHVRASHGIGMKSVTCDCNLVALCGGHHRYKTEHGRTARPILLDYLERFAYVEHPHLGLGVRYAEHVACVDPCGPTCRARVA